MEKATKIEKEMMTYIFKIVIEEDSFPDGRMAYHVYCPALKDYAASTWGYTKEEAIKNIQEVIQMIIEELIEDGKSIPEFSKEEAQISFEPRVAVTI